MPDGNCSHHIPIRLLPCRHIFGLRCALSWFARRTACAYCNSELGPQYRKASLLKPITGVETLFVVERMPERLLTTARIHMTYGLVRVISRGAPGEQLKGFMKNEMVCISYFLVGEFCVKFKLVWNMLFAGPSSDFREHGLGGCGQTTDRVFLDAFDAKRARTTDGLPTRNIQ
jgi:hypothetical protein